MYVAPLALVGGILYSAVLLAKCLVAPRPSSRTGYCASCGYDASKANTFTCPECGVDVRVGGISSRLANFRSRASLVAALVGWAYLVAVGTAIGLALQIRSSAFGSSRYVPMRLQAGATALDLDVWHIDFARRVMILRQGASAGAQLEIDPAIPEYVLLNPSLTVVARGSDWKQEGMDALLGHAGAPARGAAPEWDIARADLEHLLDNMYAGGADGPFFSDSPSITQLPIDVRKNDPASKLLEPAFWQSTAFLVCLAGITWASGAVLIARRRTRLLKRLATPGPVSPSVVSR